MNNVDHPVTIEQTILSIGPGQLGIERGIESVGTRLQVAAYVEIEAFVIQNLIGLMEKGLVAPAPVWADLKSFTGQSFYGKIHGITAGYPCQPFSIAGNRKGAEDPRHLFPDIERVIGAARPIWCFFENVAGHLRIGFDQVYKSLRDLGYSVEAGIYTAEEVGAPHQRERLFILALQLGNAKISLSPYDRQVQGRDKFKVRGSSDEVAHTNEHRYRGNNKGRFQPKAIGKSKTMADPLRFDVNQVRQESKPGQLGSDGSYWPLGPGPHQHEWEAPRVLESRLGCTVDGYNFREDLLRMYGNGVVEQTAALAWKDLWKKMSEL